MLDPLEILGPDGRIAQRLDHYERRPEQLEMADSVARALAEQQHLVTEAGTGVGKSFAYLVPAILMTTELRDPDDPPVRMVVSTHTISLQEQLLQKDLPLLNSVIPREFTAVLVKGRGNYVSLRRLELAMTRAPTLFDEQRELNELQGIAEWATKTTDGSLSDMPTRPSPGVWDEVKSDNGNCLGRNCPRHERCFFYKARRRVFNAQLLVVNHAIFFSDLALRRHGATILPPYDGVIFDEAHTLEAVAGDHLGVSVTSGQVRYILNKLYNDRKERGLLVFHDLPDSRKQVLRCQQASDEFFERIRQWRELDAADNGRVRTARQFKNMLGPELCKASEQLRQFAPSLADESNRKDLLSAADRLDNLVHSLQHWIEQADGDAVYWVEAYPSRRRAPFVKLGSAPIDIGPVLREHLFENTKSVVFTSATLTVGRPPGFEFFRSRIGLTQADEKHLGSPFDFRRQAKLILVANMPDPATQKLEFERKCLAMVRRYVERTSGHAFVLFTSYQLMRTLASQLTGWLTQNNLALYSQAEGLPRSEMLARFKKNPQAVLFGTDSFWQGVDVPGDALQNVIITKLPFSVPDQPLLQARLESIRNAGGNPFMDFQLPEAVIKLRQGFGRLIRSQRDRGIVVILDPRVRTKPYGSVFLQSLPDCEVVEETC